MALWGSWVEDCIAMLDGDGAFAHLPESGNMREQPHLDMEIYKVIRGRWVELKNEELESKWPKT